MNQNELLRRALDNEPVPRDLEARVRTRIQQTGRNPRGNPWARLISSIALLVVMLGGMQIFASRKTRELLQAGVDDHIHCAIAGAYPRQTQRVEMVEGLGPYAPLLQPILDQTPGDSVVSAHRCTINGRAYVHIILRRGETLLSVILTKRGTDEVFPKTLAMQLIHASGVPLREGSLDGYSVAGFDAGGYLGYVVSAMPDQQNHQLAGRLAPVVRRYTGA